jgi:hypothetical protein
MALGEDRNPSGQAGCNATKAQTPFPMRTTLTTLACEDELDI